MKRVRTFGFIAALVSSSFVPGIAFADDELVTEYSFTDDLVRGDLVRPTGEILHARRRGERDSLIRVRENFIAELFKSVENL